MIPSWRLFLSIPPHRAFFLRCASLYSSQPHAILAHLVVSLERCIFTCNVFSWHFFVAVLPLCACARLCEWTAVHNIHPTSQLPWPWSEWLHWLRPQTEKWELCTIFHCGEEFDTEAQRLELLQLGYPDIYIKWDRKFPSRLDSDSQEPITLKPAKI